MERKDNIKKDYNLLQFLYFCSYTYIRYMTRIQFSLYYVNTCLQFILYTVCRKSYIYKAIYLEDKKNKAFHNGQTQILFFKN